MNKKIAVSVISILSVLLVITLSFGVVQSLSKNDFEKKYTSDCSRAFYELIENIEKIDTLFKKASLVTDSYQLIKIAADIHTYSAFAISDLGELNTGKEIPEKISIFLNQAGDYVKATALKYSSEETINEEDKRNFIELSKYSQLLRNALEEIGAKALSGEISFIAPGDREDALANSISGIEKDKMIGFENLSYDGAFSVHMNTLGAVMLKEKPLCTKEEALKKAQECLYDNLEIVLKGETEGQIPSYIFSSDAKDAHYSVEISKNGAMLLSLTCGRIIGESTVGKEEAMGIAKDYLEKLGYDSMKETSYENSGGILTINFAYEKDNVVMYPDLIKVQIALDNGGIIGFEAHGYLMNHRERGKLVPQITEEQALSKVPFDFKLEEINIALIPTEYADEFFCYEIKGNYMERAFAVYINAISGRQEEIMIIEKNENGTKSY